jgi:hypothetical protein
MNEMNEIPHHVTIRIKVTPITECFILLIEIMLITNMVSLKYKSFMRTRIKKTRELLTIFLFFKYGIIRVIKYPRLFSMKKKEQQTLNIKFLHFFPSNFFLNDKKNKFY